MKNYGAIEDLLTNLTYTCNQSSSEDGKHEDRRTLTRVEAKERKKCQLSFSKRMLHPIVMPVFLVLFVTSVLLWSYYSNPLQSSSSSGNNDQIIKNEKNQITTYPMSFDYIVVGAGPAGIIAAYYLARGLQQREQKNQLQNNGKILSREEGDLPKVLLMESGTLSQSGVLKVLQNMSEKGENFNRYPYKGKYADPLLLHNLDVNEPVFTDTSLDLNKFDVPYYWTDLSKHAREGMDKTDSLYSVHHWPINQTFLGRAVGGSGVHNAMINVRALASDFDRWNVTNWTPEIMLPYFDKLESYDYNNSEVPFWTQKTDSSLQKKNDRVHDGPVKVQQAGSIKMKLDPIAEAFVSSAIAAGIPLASMGFNDNDEKRRKGVGLYEFNIRNGIRDSVASALLSEDRIGYEKPDNLVIWTSCTVHKVIFDSSSKPRAIGVLFDSGNINEMHKVMLKEYFNSTANSEVILAAGAILTPQLLSNSGIRDGGDIANLNAVGQNLQDHPVVAVSYEESELLEDDVSRWTRTDAISKSKYLDALKYWKANTTLTKTKDDFIASENLGVLGTAAFAAGAFLASPWSVDGIPDIQLTVFPRTKEPHYYDNLIRKKSPRSMKNILVTVALLRPEGRRFIEMPPYHDFQGFILPTLYPKENSQYLTEFDIQRISWGIKEVRNIMSHKPLANETKQEIFPGSDLRSDKDLRDFVLRESMPNSHWCGSTKMGKAPKDSVVDEKLKVHGVDSLRVVDAGVMPFIPNGNTHSTTCAVALRGVDLILEYE